MDISDLVKELKPEMYREETWRDIAEAIGVENFYKLTKAIGGETVYIPKPESIIRPVRDLHIKTEFNGYNHSELAKKYEVTERWVRELCGPGIVEGQIDLWSEGNALS